MHMCVKDIITKIKSLFLKDLKAEGGGGVPVIIELIGYLPQG